MDVSLPLFPFLPLSEINTICKKKKKKKKKVKEPGTCFPGEKGKAGAKPRKQDYLAAALGGHFSCRIVVTGDVW